MSINTEIAGTESFQSFIGKTNIIGVHLTDDNVVTLNDYFNSNRVVCYLHADRERYDNRNYRLLFRICQVEEDDEDTRFYLLDEKYRAVKELPLIKADENGTVALRAVVNNNKKLLMFFGCNNIHSCDKDLHTGTMRGGSDTTIRSEISVIGDLLIKIGIPATDVWICEQIEHKV